MKPATMRSAANAVDCILLRSAMADSFVRQLRTRRTGIAKNPRRAGYSMLYFAAIVHVVVTVEHFQLPQRSQREVILDEAPRGGDEPEMPLRPLACRT